MNTGLGNVIIMTGLIHAYAACKNLTIDLINNGDDCVVFMESRDITQFTSDFKDWSLEMGYRMAIEPPVYSLPKIEFCQMHPIRISDGIVMVRNINTSTSKDALSTLDLRNPTLRAKWFSAVGECGSFVTGGIPIVNAFYKMYQRWGGGAASRLVESPQFQTSGFYHLSLGVETLQIDPTPETRLDVFLAWGITPDEQISLENYYNSLDYQDCGSIGYYEYPHLSLLNPAQ